MSIVRWGAASLALAMIAALTVAPARERAVALVPQSAALFVRLGLPVNLDRLEIGSVQASVRTEDGRRVLIVEGQVRNPGRTATTLPSLRVSLRDGAGMPVYSWTTSPGAKTVAAHGHQMFRTRLTAPPDSQDVSVEFVRPSDVVAKGNSASAT